MNSKVYRLEGKEPVVCSTDEFAKILRYASRVIAREIVGDAEVSTVFLGIDHRFFGDGPPILFETMIFGGKHDLYQERYASWDEAMEAHRRVVAMLTEEALHKSET